MKTSRSTVILALCTLLIGALLIAFPTHATKWLIMAIGALFLGPGLYTVGTYILQRRRKPNNIAKQNDKSSKDDKDKEPKVASFPFIGIGSILFGSVLLIIPSSFLNALLYLLGAFLLLAGAAQLYRLIKLRKHYQLGALPYVVSSLISIAGIVIIILNYNTATDKAGQEPITSYIFGVASIIFGLSEIIYAIQFRNSGKDAIPEPEDGEEDKPMPQVEEKTTAAEPQAPETPKPLVTPQPQVPVSAPQTVASQPQVPVSAPQTAAPQSQVAEMPKPQTAGESTPNTPTREASVGPITYTSTQTFETPSSSTIEAEVDGEV